jgi:hypothetical protein
MSAVRPDFTPYSIHNNDLQNEQKPKHIHFSTAPGSHTIQSAVYSGCVTHNLVNRLRLYTLQRQSTCVVQSYSDYYPAFIQMCSLHPAGNHISMLCCNPGNSEYSHSRCHQPSLTLYTISYQYLCGNVLALRLRS